MSGRALAKKRIVNLFPATLFAVDDWKMKEAIRRIREELKERVKFFEEQGKLVEAQRIKQRTEYDIEMLEEIGTCSGIENYSRHIGLREEGRPPIPCLISSKGFSAGRRRIPRHPAPGPGYV